MTLEELLIDLPFDARQIDPATISYSCTRITYNLNLDPANMHARNITIYGMSQDEIGNLATEFLTHVRLVRRLLK